LSQRPALKVGDDAQGYWHTNEPLLRGCVLSTVVDLLPESELIVGACVEVVTERDAGDPVEHKVGYLSEAAELVIFPKAERGDVL